MDASRDWKEASKILFYYSRNKKRHHSHYKRMAKVLRQQPPYCTVDLEKQLHTGGKYDSTVQEAIATPLSPSYRPLEQKWMSIYVMDVNAVHASSLKESC